MLNTATRGSVCDVFLDGGGPVLPGESPDSSAANSDYDLLVARPQSDSIFAHSFE